jgi:hypothetical protein
MYIHTWNRIKFGTWLSIVLIAISTAIVANAYRTEPLALSSAATVAQVNAPDLLEGIDLTGSFTNEDVAYLQEGLQFLRDYVPQWYVYIAEAEPLLLSVDLSEGERGLAATSKCCDERGYGLITFGAHFRDSSNDSEGQTVRTRQIAFLSTLIHEVTHIRDGRAGHIPTKIDFVTCVKSERSAFTQEVEFKRAFVSATPSIPVLNNLDHFALEKQISVEASALGGNAVNLYCLPAAVSGSE